MLTPPPPLPANSPVPILWPAVRLLLIALVVTPAGAEIFKCTAGSGEVTYQNEPCPKSGKADRVDIFDNTWTADRAEKEAHWQRQADGGHVVAGMPLHWVRAALGEPAEIRDTATAGAKEVWLYNFADRSVQVGILADQVLWSRETPVIAPLTRIVPEPDRAATGTPRAAADPARVVPDASGAMPNAPRAVLDASGAMPNAPRAMSDTLRVMPDVPRAVPEAPSVTPESSRQAQVSPMASESRHGVARGQDCKQALAELGTPDRQREVPAIDSASDAMTEYFYEPPGRENPTRLRVVCVKGKVEGVDHAVTR